MPQALKQQEELIQAPEEAGIRNNVRGIVGEFQQADWHN
jgi:hypothetical protein